MAEANPSGLTPEQQKAAQDKAADEAAKQKAKKGKFEVVSDFRDANNFDLTHYAGSDVSHFDKERLKKLEELGYVKRI
jgi:hypothetical protein